MVFVVVYDACVLFPAPIRDLLVRLGTTGLFQAKWSERILDECFRNVLEKRPPGPQDCLGAHIDNERCQPIG